MIIRIGDTTYFFLQEALDAAKDGDAVLDGDVTIYAFYDLNQVAVNAAPELEVKGVTINASEKLDLLSLVVSDADAEDGDLADKVEFADNGGFDNQRVGEYKVVFRVADKEGASVVNSDVVKVVEANSFVSSKTDASDNKMLAATGDNTNVIVLITALVCSAAFIILLREKKLMIKAFQNRQ